MLGNYQPSPYDLRFSVLGIPVRVTPMFWLGSVILGWNALEQGPPFLLMWVIVCFVSILVHELGHAFVARWQGCQVIETALYLMGGVAVYLPGRHFTAGRSILISLAGPGAGFLLYALVNYVLKEPVIQLTQRHLDPTVMPLVLDGLWNLLYINWWWGLVNLLPVYPLDGGQICRAVCLSINPAAGDDYTRRISIVVGGAAAVYLLTHDNTYAGVLFLSLTLNNLQLGR